MSFRLAPQDNPALFSAELTEKQKNSPDRDPYVCKIEHKGVPCTKMQIEIIGHYPIHRTVNDIGERPRHNERGGNALQALRSKSP